MIQRADFAELFRVEKKMRVERRGDPLDYGFRASNFFGGVPKMLDGEVLIVSRTRAGAQAYGRSEFGFGEYQCYRIDARGCPPSPMGKICSTTSSSLVYGSRPRMISRAP
ncbi:hypothetical protein QNM99_18360 [Pseudomonas sp. PCH446]